MQLGRWKNAAAAAGAALTLLAGPAALRAQGTITGRVTQDGGRPLADARVLAIGTSLSAATNDSGKFTLKNAPVGTVQLQVLRVGFQSLKKSVTVTSGETVNADFVLPIAGAPSGSSWVRADFYPDRGRSVCNEQPRTDFAGEPPWDDVAKAVRHARERAVAPAVAPPSASEQHS